MLKLSSDQTAVFAEEARRAYEDRVIDFLREKFDDARALRRRDVRPFVRSQIAKADGYGLISEQQVAAYVMLAWLLGVDFDEKFPLIQRALIDPTIDPEEKVTFLIEHTAEFLNALSEG